MRLDKNAEDDEPGVNIDEVFPESAAALAGIQAGDRLLTLDGRWTDGVGDAYAAAAGVTPGRKITVTLRRGTKELALPIAPTAGF